MEAILRTFSRSILESDIVNYASTNAGLFLPVVVRCCCLPYISDHKPFGCITKSGKPLILESVDILHFAEYPTASPHQVRMKFLVLCIPPFVLLRTWCPLRSPSGVSFPNKSTLFRRSCSPVHRNGEVYPSGILKGTSRDILLRHLSMRHGPFRNRYVHISWQ